MKDQVFDLLLFTEKLRYHRDNLDMGLRDAAKQCNLSASTLSRIENGGMPDTESFFRICKWMILPANYFMKKTQTPKNE